MKHMTPVRVGTYPLTDNMTIGIRASDDGTVLTIRELLSGRTTTAVINEHGEAVRPQADRQVSFRASTPDSEPSSESPVPFNEDSKDSRIEVLGTPRLPPPAPTGKRKPKQIRFTLLFNAKCHPKSRPHALVGYTNGDVTHVLYRTAGGRSGVHTDRHMRIADGRIWIGSQIRSSERVSKDEWEEISALPEHTSFQFAGHLPMWQKMTDDELRARMEEQTFRVIHEPSKSVPPPPVLSKTASSSDRRVYKSRHVSVLACEPGNFDHADGEPSSILIVGHEGVSEAISINLQDTRRLVVSLLVSLWTADDSHAENVLEKFPIDEGVYFWPKEQ